MKGLFVFLASAAVVAAALVACSSDSSSSSSSTGGTPTGDGGASSSSSGGSSSSSSGGSDAGADVVLDIGPGVKSCAGTFVDRTDAAATRTIAWDADVASKPEHCMTIKVGQKVKWNGDFTTHPLEANGAEAQNPIHADIGDTGEITFNAAGTFGYICGFHAAELGAIKVVP